MRGHLLVFCVVVAVLSVTTATASAYQPLSSGEEIPTGTSALAIMPCQAGFAFPPFESQGPGSTFRSERIESVVQLVKPDDPNGLKVAYSRLAADKVCFGVHAEDEINDPGKWELIVTRQPFSFVGYIVSPGGSCGEDPSPPTCRGWASQDNPKVMTITSFRVVGLPKRFDKAAKAEFARVAARDNNYLIFFGAAFSFCGLAGPLSPGCAVVAGVTLATIGLEYYLYSELAKDPVDYRYKSVAKPRAMTPPSIGAGGGVTATLAKALTALQTNSARQGAYTQALLTALNRAQGAHLKHARAAERRQLKAAQAAAAKLAPFQSAQPKLLAAVQSTLAASPLGALTVNANQILEARAQAGTSLPAAVTARLRALGAPPTASKIVQSGIVNADASALKGGTLAGTLTDRSRQTALKKSATALRAFSRKHQP